MFRVKWLTHHHIIALKYSESDYILIFTSVLFVSTLLVIILSFQFGEFLSAFPVRWVS